MAGGYQLWAPRSPLDESLRWLRGPAPRATYSTRPPFPRGRSPESAVTATDLEVQLCFQGLSLVLEPGVKGATGPTFGAAGEARGQVARVQRPQAVRLRGLDTVFGRRVTVRAPRWTGSLRASEPSAFRPVVSSRQRWPRGLREPQAHMATSLCRQMLRAILLLYAAYKKCAWALQHSC
nr:FANCD2 opposite strand protein-like [Anolis sagrei ordinatus]